MVVNVTYAAAERQAGDLCSVFSRPGVAVLLGQQQHEGHGQRQMVEAVDVGVVPLLQAKTRQPDSVIKTQTIDSQMSGRHLSSGLGFVFTMRHLKVEAQHQSEGAEAAAWTDLLRVNALLWVDGPQLLHLLQLEHQPDNNKPGRLEAALSK